MFRNTDELVSILEIEEIEVNNVVIFRRLENVERDTMGDAAFFVYRVEEAKKKLEQSVLITSSGRLATYVKPFEDHV
jgi:hypothetical protein